MTLKELFTTVEFDSLFPYLKEHEPDHLDSLQSFREVYDILRNMERTRNIKEKPGWHGTRDRPMTRKNGLVYSIWTATLRKIPWRKKSSSQMTFTFP